MLLVQYWHYVLVFIMLMRAPDQLANRTCGYTRVSQCAPASNHGSSMRGSLYREKVRFSNTVAHKLKIKSLRRLICMSEDRPGGVTAWGTIGWARVVVLFSTTP